MTDAIDLTTAQRKALSELLRRFLPGVAVWAYGSRVKWTARPNSDLDLVAFTTPAQRSQVEDLKDALAESNLPFPVDLHVWDDAPERFREIIKKEYVVVQEAKEPEPKTSKPDKWRTRPLGELAEIFDGPHATPAKTQSGPIFLGISNLAQGRVNLSEVEHLSEDDYVRWTRRVEPRAGDVVFSYETRLGEAACVPQGLRCCLGRRMGLLRARRGEIDERFLLYAYLGPQFQETLRSRTVPGSTVDRIPLIDMPQFPMVVPTDLVEQRAIAHILGTLDDKIELNRRMNETLEAMARALFKSWFVDFDPVRTKAEGRDPGLPQPLADLFPDSLVDSELGEIPRGWGARSLYETAEFINGAAFKSEDFCDPSVGLPIVKIAELKDGIGVQTRFSDRVLDPKQLIDTGELLYSWSGSPDTSLDAFLWTKGRGSLNQHIFKVITPTIAEKRFVYYLLKCLKPTLVEIARNKQTTGLGHVTVADMKRLCVCSPAQNVLAAFNDQVAPLFDRAFKCTVQNQTLTALRDTLLPKLISGELRLTATNNQPQSA